MFWRIRKVKRDRAAGMVFDWRRGHGSTWRLALSIVVSALVWGGLLASLQIRGPQPMELEDDRIDLTLVDLDDDRGRWLAELIDRETLFQESWPVTGPEQSDEVVGQILSATNLRAYEPVPRELPPLTSKRGTAGVPGRGSLALPAPDAVAAVTFAAPPAHWWIEVEVIEGPEGFREFAFPFPAEDDPQIAALMSEGESWTLVVVVDWRGVVVSLDGSWEKDNDPRTGRILEKIRARGFSPLPVEAPLRIWRLRATVVNRPESQ